MVRRAPALFVAIVALSTPVVSQAQWVPDGTAVCTAPTQQSEPCIVADGSGGAIIAWKDARLGATQIFAQHLDLNGMPVAGWPANGIQVSIATLAQVPRAVSDGAGGAIVLWCTPEGIGAQRITGAGELLWPTTGVRLCTAPVVNFEAIADGAGGVIVAWEDARLGAANTDIYARRVSAAGDTAWTGNGLPVCTSARAQVLPTLTNDGAGGAIVAWIDPRIGTSTRRVFAQRVTAAGGAAWASDGVNAGGAGDVYNRAMCAAVDGAGGAYVVWIEWTGASHERFMQHLTATGGVVPGWASGKQLIGSDYLHAKPSIAAIGSDGCIVASGSSGTETVVLERVDGSGWTPWARYFYPVLNAGGTRVVPDGTGGALVAHANNGDIQAGKVSADGSLPAGMTATGVRLCAASGIQGEVALAATGSDAAIAAWSDSRSAPGDPGGIYAARYVWGGLVAADDFVPGVDFELRLQPNPTAGALHLSFTLPADGPVRLSLTDVAGRTVLARTLDGVAGAQSLVLSEASGLRPGLYFLRLQQGDRARTEKFVVAAAR